MFAFVSAFGGAAVAPSSAFSGVRLSSRTAPAAKARFSMEASPSVPFLERPPKLDGSAPGDVGFDPLGFSNFFALDFLREAEVKHCTYIFFFLNAVCSHVCVINRLQVYPKSRKPNPNSWLISVHLFSRLLFQAVLLCLLSSAGYSLNCGTYPRICILKPTLCMLSPRSAGFQTSKFSFSLRLARPNLSTRSTMRTAPSPETTALIRLVCPEIPPRPTIMQLLKLRTDDLQWSLSVVPSITLSSLTSDCWNRSILAGGVSYLTSIMVFLYHVSLTFVFTPPGLFFFWHTNSCACLSTNFDWLGSDNSIPFLAVGGYYSH